MIKIAIIGGGAAGMMAGLSILENTQGNLQVKLFEKNRQLGAKVIISGGGRCNLTTGIEDKKVLLSKYTRGEDFIKFALGKYNPKKIREFFEKHGVKTKCEEDNRVFPVSDDGKEVVGMFEKEFAKYPNFQVAVGVEVQNIAKNNDKFEVEYNSRKEEFDIVVLTTGGQAYRQTGSAGQGYVFAKNLGHTITPLGPSLNSFKTQEDWVKELSGLALEKARVVVSEVATMTTSPLVSVVGPFLFTHFGISGPVAFSLASQIPFVEINEQKTLKIHLSPDADKTFESWEKILINEVDKSKNKLFRNVLSQYLPTRLVESLFIQFCYSLYEVKMAELSKKDRQEVSKMLGFGIPINLIQRRPGDEFVTAGGVDTDEINKKTLESKILPNLYLAGELINVDGVTGGFNLTACWAGGALIGESIKNKRMK